VFFNSSLPHHTISTCGSAPGGYQDSCIIINDNIVLQTSSETFCETFKKLMLDIIALA